MRILHIITSLRTGGAEKLVTGLLPRFLQEGHDVQLLLLDGTRTPLFTDLEASGVRIHALSKGAAAMRNPFLFGRMVRFLRKGRFDVVHTHNTSCQFLASGASLLMPLRLVTTEHNTSNRRRRRAFYRPLDRWMYSRYRQIACVGEETRAALEAYLPETKGKTLVVPNGIDLDRFSNAVPDADMARMPGTKILMVAAFRAQKDQATVIRALSLLPESFHRFLAGGAETREDAKTLESCHSLTERLNLGDRVHFLGVRHDVPALQAASDVIVISSLYEGQSLSAMEGMASGKPFVASDAEGLGPMVSGAGLLFPVGDEKRLAERILQVVEDPSLGEKVARQCRQRVSQYGITETATAYLNMYHNLI